MSRICPRFGHTLSLLLLAAVGCGGPDPLQRHLERELSFFRTGVSLDAERRAVERALLKADMRVVSEVRGPGFVALGAASPRFAQTAVRVISKRGVVAGHDAKRDAVLRAGRLHLLEDAPLNVGPLSLVAWVYIAEGDTAGCAAVIHVDAEGYIHTMRADVSLAGDVACVGSLHRRQGELWGTVVWPGLSFDETPTLEVPLALEQRKLDDQRPPSRLHLRGAEGWTGPARQARQGRLVDLVSFAQRHAIALELAALDLFDGLDTNTQRATYTQTAGVPAGQWGRELWSATVALIERGWMSEGARAQPDAPTETPAPSSVPPEPDDVLQDADDGQEAQKEASDAG